MKIGASNLWTWFLKCEKLSLGIILNCYIRIMKKLVFISLLCTLMFMANDVSYAAGLPAKPGIENVWNGPPAINPVWNILNNTWTIYAEKQSPVNPKQTLIACDNANTISPAKPYLAVVQKYSRYWCGNTMVNTNIYLSKILTGGAEYNRLNLERCNGPRNPRDGL